jgi:hypothetical protein
LGKHQDVYAGKSGRLKFPEYVIVKECWIQHRSTVKLFNWSALNVTVIESIIKNLETLPASKLVEVAHFINGLNPNRRNERIAALKATAGSMPGEEGEAFEKAVREEADRIDADAWK